MAKRKPLEKGRAYKIKWQDAQYDGDHQGQDDDSEIGRECYTLGWLVKETPKGIRLAMEKDTDESENYRFFFDIPKKVVMEVEEI